MKTTRYFTLISGLLTLLMLGTACGGGPARLANDPEADSLPLFEPAYRYETKYAQAGTLRIAYAESGRENPQKLLLVHGLGGSLAHWEKNLDSLGEHFHCIAIDLPGYGRSERRYEPPADDYISFFARTLFAFADDIGWEKFGLAGHSMGGQTAIVAALAQPQRIEKLILLAPAGIETFGTVSAALLKKTATAQFFYNMDSATIRNSVLSNFVQMPADAERFIGERIAMKSARYFADYCNVVAGGVAGMLDRPVAGQLAKITCPTLIIFGAEDQLIPNRLLNKELTTAQVANTAREQIPGSQLVMIGQAGHLVQYEQHQAVNNAIIAFLKP